MSKMGPLALAKVATAAITLAAVWMHFLRSPFIAKYAMPERWDRWVFDTAHFAAVAATTIVCAAIILQKGAHSILLWPYIGFVGALFVGVWVLSLLIAIYPATLYTHTRDALRDYATANGYRFSPVGPEERKRDLSSEYAPRAWVTSPDGMELGYVMVGGRTHEGPHLSPAIVCVLPTTARPEPRHGARALHGQGAKDGDLWTRVHEQLSEDQKKLVRRSMLKAEVEGGRFRVHLVRYPKTREALGNLVELCRGLRDSLEAPLNPGQPAQRVN